MRKLTAVMSLVFILSLGLISFEARSGFCLQTGDDFDYCNKYKKDFGGFKLIYLQCDTFQSFDPNVSVTDRCTKIPE